MYLQLEACLIVFIELHGYICNGSNAFGFYLPLLKHTNCNDYYIVQHSTQFFAELLQLGFILIFYCFVASCSPFFITLAIL